MAQKEGLLADEILPVKIDYSDGSSVVVEKDQNPREDTTLEKLATLKPVFGREVFEDAGRDLFLRREGRAAQGRRKP